MIAASNDSVNSLNASGAHHAHAFVIHLVGGGSLKMMLEARDLSDVQHALQHHRALIGRHIFESNIGLEESMPALIPATRVQMVIDCEH